MLSDAIRTSFRERSGNDRLGRALEIGSRDDPLKVLMSGTAPQIWDYEESLVGPVPGRLHPKQDEALHADATHRFLIWANQSGKTSFAAIDVALLALGRHPTLQRWDEQLTIWCSSLTWELWETVQLPELLTWLPPHRVISAPEPFKKSTKRTILVQADNGTKTRIEGKSAEQGREKYQARRVHLIWFDEEHPEDIWNEAQMRLARHGGITLTSATPLKGFSWVYHRIYEPYQQGRRPKEDYFISHAGIADNPAIAPEVIERIRTSLAGNRAQIQARLYGQFAAAEGVALEYDPRRHTQAWTDQEIRDAIEEERLSPFAGIDFGFWRFACILCASDMAGRVHVFGEVFSQKETLDTRAEKVDGLFTRLGVPARVRIWGDSANPTDILEFNEALKRIGSPYRVVGVHRDNKIRATSVERLNNLLHNTALLIRRSLNETHTWRLGFDTASDGHPVTGSRLVWELQNWSFPERKEGEAQRQDPDDNTADGADSVAALRYAVMSWWKEARGGPGRERLRRKKAQRDPHFDYHYDKVMEHYRQAEKRKRERWRARGRDRWW